MSQLSCDVFVAPELALAGDDLPPRLSTRTWGPVSATWPRPDPGGALAHRHRFWPSEGTCRQVAGQTEHRHGLKMCRRRAA